MPEDSIIVEFTPSDLPRRFVRAGGKLNKEFKLGMKDAFVELQKATPPVPIPSRKPQPFKTAKQRRFFFWALRTGRIEVPYPRTGRMRRSLSGRTGESIRNTRPIGTAGVVGEFGTRTKYAPLVIGTRTQARYHRGTWWTMADIVRRGRDGVIRAFGRMTERMANFLGGKGA